MRCGVPPEAVARLRPSVSAFDQLRTFSSLGHTRSVEPHEQAEWNGTKGFLGGLYGAALYISAPMLIGLIIMSVFGEGDYILALWTVLYAALGVYGERTRRAAPLRTYRRSLGFNIVLGSVFLALLCGTGAILFATDGGWRDFG